MFVQNFIKISAAIIEGSWKKANKT